MGIYVFNRDVMLEYLDSTEAVLKRRVVTRPLSMIISEHDLKVIDLLKVSSVW